MKRRARADEIFDSNRSLKKHWKRDHKLRHCGLSVFGNLKQSEEVALRSKAINLME